jgi:FAD dependent oxidoreductase TIGR03364
MRVSRRELQADVCVVGAGMVGLAHAFEARRRGLSVVLLERDAHAVGASVRNFGHLFVGSQPDGPVLEMALRSRERWLELAAAAGLPLVNEGTIIVARAEDELAVLESALANSARRARMLSAAEVLERVPLPAAEIVGGLHSPLDLRVNPREAVARLVLLLAADADVTVVWRAHVHAVEPGVVDATEHGVGEGAAPLRVRAGATIVCPGPDYRELAPELAPGLGGLTRCRLQMLRIAAPQGRRYGPALATGYSLVRYPAFVDHPATAALRSRYERERPELLEAGIHLLITQLPDGDLIIGDSHAYGDTLDAFAEERISDLLLREAGRLLGAELTVRERWLGLYATRAVASARYEPFHVTAPMPRVRVVENVTGIGMTLSLGFAPDVFDTLDEPDPAGVQSSAVAPSAD